MKVLLGSLVILVAATPSLLAQRSWQGGDGDWHDPANWTTGVPVAATQIQFPTPTEAGAITVSIDEDAVGRSVTVAPDVDLTLALGSGVSLTTSSSWRLGYGIGSATGAARLTVAGPESGIGSLNLTAGTESNQFFINHGSTVILKGANLRVESVGASLISSMAGSHDNAIELQDGVIYKANGLRLGWTTATTGGAGRNEVRVRSGSTLEITGSAVEVGNNVGHFQNRLSVEGAGSKVEMGAQDILIGNSAETNHGGNAVEVAGGGALATSGNILINGYDATATGTYGANRVTIGSGGTLTSTGAIDVGAATSESASLLQLEDGGVLNGAAAITVNRNAIFEAAGNGLGSDVTISVKADGTLATGSDELTQSVILALKGESNFEEGSFLRLAIRENGVDQIDFAANSTLTGNVKLLLDFDEATVGGIYTLFTGDTSGVTATLDLSSLDALLWDVSLFNEQGGWRLQAIPEPSSLAFLAVGAVFAGWMGRRRFGRRVLPVLMGAGMLGMATAGADEVVTVLDGEMEVERSSEIRLPVVLPEVSPDHEAVLEFTAWYPAPKHAGYYAGMRVYWGAEEVEDILDRPETFQTNRGRKDGRHSPIRRKKWWMVPVVQAPEAFDPQDSSYVSPDQLNPFLFRFRLPTATGQGEYELRITNSMKHEQDPIAGYRIFPTMKVRDIVVRLEPKS